MFKNIVPIKKNFMFRHSKYKFRLFFFTFCEYSVFTITNYEKKKILKVNLCTERKRNANTKIKCVLSSCYY